MISSDFLMSRRKQHNAMTAQELGISEREVVKAYWRECRVPGTPIPMTHWGSCERCMWREQCDPRGRVMCESVQMWESER